MLPPPGRCSIARATIVLKTDKIMGYIKLFDQTMHHVKGKHF